ncbi:DUF417 family protein, partial [Escherichia coli]
MRGTLRSPPRTPQQRPIVASQRGKIHPHESVVQHRRTRRGVLRLLAILRWVMVVIFVSFGMQKFTLQSAQGIAQFISNSTFISWLSVFGLRG